MMPYGNIVGRIKKVESFQLSIMLYCFSDLKHINIPEHLLLLSEASI